MKSKALDHKGGIPQELRRVLRAFVLTLQCSKRKLSVILFRYNFIILLSCNYSVNDTQAPACVACTQVPAIDEDKLLPPPPAAFASAAATVDIVTAPAAAAAGMDSEGAAPSHAAEVLRPSRRHLVCRDATVDCFDTAHRNRCTLLVAAEVDPSQAPDTPPLALPLLCCDAVIMSIFFKH